MVKEIFKTAQYIREDGSIEIFEGYEVSNYGRVKSLGNDKMRKEKILKPGTYNKYGHLRVILYKDNKKYPRRVHRLVLSTFDPEGYFDNAVVDHIDSNPSSNILNNLRWTTHKENNNTEHFKRALSEARLGKKLSDETKKKMSEAKLGKCKGSKHPNTQSCIHDNRTFSCIKEAYEYTRSQCYIKSYDAFKRMIKKEQMIKQNRAVTR